MKRPRDMQTVEECETALDIALADLRKLLPSDNLVARGSIEYRIARLRQRREELR